MVSEVDNVRPPSPDEARNDTAVEQIQIDLTKFIFLFFPYT